MTEKLHEVIEALHEVVDELHGVIEKMQEDRIEVTGKKYSGGQGK
jgi:hypothetical protein